MNTMKRFYCGLFLLAAVGLVGTALFQVVDTPAQAQSGMWPDQNGGPWVAAVCSTVVNDASRPFRLNLTPPTGLTCFERVQIIPVTASGAQALNFSFWLSSASDSTAGWGYVSGAVSDASGAAGPDKTWTFDVRCKYIRCWNFDATDDYMVIGWCRR